MSVTSKSFVDEAGDELALTFCQQTGGVQFDGYSVSDFDFSGETTQQITEWLVAQLNTLTPEPLVEAAQARSVATVTTEDNARANWNATAFQAAKELGLGVEFKYSKGNTGGIETRTLAEVDEVRETAKGHTVVVGYDEDREDPRMFRVDWVKGYVKVND